MDDCNTEFPLAGKVVLVCEDSAIIALDCETLLLGLGASGVQLAGTVPEARALIDTGFDLAILDWNLNGENTLAIADELRARNVPLLFVSGYAEIRQIAERFPEAQLIAKPYAVDVFSNACRRALDGRVRGRKPAGR